MLPNPVTRGRKRHINICHIRKRQFVHKYFYSQFLCPLIPPPPNQQSDRFPLEFLLKGPQTELRTLSQNCEQTFQELRTNRIMNKRAFLTHKQFLGHPGHRSSRPGTRFLPAGYPDENVYVPWVPHIAHKLWTPGHRSGEPPPHPVGRPPPPGQSPEKLVYVYVPSPFLSYRPKNTTSRDPYPPSSRDPLLAGNPRPPLCTSLGRGKGSLLESPVIH